MTESKSTRKPNADGVRTLPASVSLPESLIRIAERVSARGCRLFAVGGLVRNTLLGLPVSDIDICSALTPDETIELAHEMGFKVVPKGIAFGMVEIHDHQKHLILPFAQERILTVRIEIRITGVRVHQIIKRSLDNNRLGSYHIQ